MPIALRSQSHRRRIGAEEAAAGNGLLNALIAYWPGNEASGKALDAHTNGLDLPDVSTVGSNTGHVYALARDYANDYHTRAGDDALLSAGDTDFTLAAWVYLDSKPTIGHIAGKATSNGDYEYWMNYASSVDRLQFTVSHDGLGASAVPRRADSLGSPSLSTWYLVIGWHDSVANTTNIQVNNGTVDSGGHATGVKDGVNPFRIGFNVGVNYWDGRIGPTMFWKSAAGGGGVLTADQRTALYNAGAGLAYASFTT